MAQTNRGKPAHPNEVSEWIDLDVPNRLPIIPLVSSVLFPSYVRSKARDLDIGDRLFSDFDVPLFLVKDRDRYDEAEYKADQRKSERSGQQK